MNQALSKLLDDLYARSRAHDEQQPDRLDRWRNVDPAAARLLSVLVRALAPARLLELGTSNGYSTIWLAEAATAVGGQLTSVELDPQRSRVAAENLRAAGLESAVDLLVADAASVLAEAAPGSWEFIFLDAERAAYSAYLPDLVRTLSPRGLLVVDNVLSHPDEVAEFIARLAADGRLSHAVDETAAGLLIAVREPAG